MLKNNEINISTEALVKISIMGLTLLFSWYIRDIIVLLLLSITLAAALDSLVDFLSTKRIPRALSLFSVYFLVICMIFLVGYLVIPTVILQFEQLSSPEVIDLVHNRLGPLSRFHIGEKILREVQTYMDEATSISGGVFQKTIGAFSGVMDIISVMVISFYLAAEHHGLQKVFYSIMPSNHHKRIARLIDKIQHKIGMWMIGQLMLSAIVFLLSFIGLYLLGIKFALVLAILAGFCELIPYIGPLIAAVPAIIFAFIQNPPTAIAVAVLYLLIQKTEGYVLVPKIMQRTVGVSPVFILLAILIGLKIAGVFGVFLAVPVVAAIATYIQEPAVEVIADGSD